jgi:hypothetical protein
MPYRLRFRFGSDGDTYPQDPQGGWSLAGARVDGSTPRYDLALSTLSASRMAAEFQSSDPAQGSVSLHWRRAPSDQWIPLAPAQLPDATGSARFEFATPPAPYFEVGAFEGDLAATLLVREGMRIAQGAGLSAFPCPSAGEVNFETAISSQARVLSIYNVQGRLVGQVPFPAQLGVVAWNGRDDAGASVVSGVYLASLSGPTGGRVSFVIVR